MNQHFNPKRAANRASALAERSSVGQVEALALDLAATLQRQDQFEGEMLAANASKDGTTQAYLQSALCDLADRNEMLREVIAGTRAVSLTDAAIQIAESINLLDLTIDGISDDAMTYQAKAQVRALNRLLYSALGAVDAAADRKIADIVPSPSFTNHNLNPWTPVEDRIRSVKDFLQERG